MATSSLEHILRLFDSTWFQHQIITRRSPAEHRQEAELSLEEELEKPKLLETAPTILVRSRSDQQILISSGVSFLSDSESPTSVLPTPRLTTIFSGKEASEFDEAESKQEIDQLAQPGKAKTSTKMSVKSQRTRRNRVSSSSKSLTDLMFEELKGFMDLGFVFSDEDRTDTDLVSIVPGLQRLAGKKSENEDAERLNDAGSVHRPYLSEAWEAMEKKEAVMKPVMIMRQKIKEVGLENERVMKEQIKFWARSIASAIR